MANMKNMMDPRYWMKSKKDKLIADAKASLEGPALDKELATINEEPYVNVLHMDVDKINPRKGYVELDFNEFFVKMLQEADYTGSSDEDIVNSWFNDLCRTILQQELADQDFGLQSPQGPADVVKVTEDDIEKVKRGAKGD